MSLTLEQHRKLGRELQTYHNQAQTIGMVIAGAYPQKHPVCMAAMVFTGFQGSLLFDLRSVLDNLVCREYPPRSGATKIYFCNGQPNCQTPELFGLPLKTGAQLNKLCKKRQMTPRRKAKPRLTVFELHCIIRCLHHIGNRVAVIGIGLMDTYHPNTEPADKAQACLDGIALLITKLFDELAKLQGVDQ